jgi:hypothetical protein
MRARCEHGLSGDLDERGDPRCQLCRHLLGLLPAAAPPPPRPDRCNKPGHEHHQRRNCPACGSERGELYGSIATRQARAAARTAIRRPTLPTPPEPGERTRYRHRDELLDPGRTNPDRPLHPTTERTDQ